MLYTYRRHRKCCPHLREGRNCLRCGCPVWVDGRLNGERIHEALKTTDWQKAQQIVRDWEADGSRIAKRSRDERIEIEQAWLRFKTDLESRKLHPSTLRKYLLLQRQMNEFAQRRSLRLLKQLDLVALDEFRSEWKDGALSACKKLERMRAFFRFSQSRKWITENPAAELRAPKAFSRPTMPFTQEEVARVLSAVDVYLSETPANGRENGLRLRAFVLLLRFSGMRISDVVSLTSERMSGNRLFLYTQKTGVPVHILLPEFVLRSLELVPRKSGTQFFWSGAGKLDSAVRSWQTRLRRLFQLARLVGGHAHRFRDTFAVELLQAGVPIERVSILLGHQSTRVTEKHYNPWVRSRQEQLEADLAKAWSRDPLVLLEGKVTRRLRGESEAVN